MQYNGDAKREGEQIIWETEFYTITLYKGLKSFDSRYDIKERIYSETLMHWGMPEEPLTPNVSKNEIQCYSYPYISYKLNAKAIEELKLNNKKI